MQTHWEFFKEQDHSFGVFYPLHYIVAAFDTHARAEEVHRIFLEAGFDDSDVADATGSFVTQKLESMSGATWLDRFKIELESMSGATWLDRFKIGFASFLGTELGYIEDDTKLAQRGAGFLFVHAPDDATTKKAEALLTRTHPLSARRYDHACIRRLIYPSQASL